MKRLGARLSVCLSVRPGLLLWARDDIDLLLHGRRSVAARRTAVSRLQPP